MTHNPGDGHSHDHDHDHDHSPDHAGAHAHGHNHVHEVTSLSQRFMWGIGFNLLFVIIEFIYGKASHSIALIADAGHNLQDVFALVLSGVALWLADRPSTEERTYGFKKGTILSAFLGSFFLVLICGGMIWEAIGRFREPEPVQSGMMMAVAAVGVAVNFGTAFLFFSSKDHELNSRSAYLHLLGDAGISAAVVLSGFIIQRTGLLWIDPVVSVGVAVAILVASWRLFKESLHQVIDGVPSHIQTDDVVSKLGGITHIHQVHHVHIWSLSTREIALTAHLQVKSLEQAPLVLKTAQELLKTQFGISHATLQIESLGLDACENCE